MRQAGLILLTLFAAFSCKAAATPPPDTEEDARLTQHPAPAIDACAAGGAECLAQAEIESDRDRTAGIQKLEHCLACTDAPAAAFRLLGSLHGESQDLAAAREVLRRGVKRHPRSASLWQQLARAELRLGHHPSGIQAFAAAARLRPADAALAQEYQQALLEHGSEEDRIEAQLQPLLLESNGRFELNDVAGAWQTLERAQKVARPHPRLHARVLHRMALVRIATGDTSAAEALLAKANAYSLQPGPLKVDILVTISELALYRGEAKTAHEAAAAAAVIQPRNPLAHTNVAIAESRLGRAKAALEALQRAFAAGLARRITRAQFAQLSFGTAFAQSPEFIAAVDQVWPPAKPSSRAP